MVIDFWMRFIELLPILSNIGYSKNSIGPTLTHCVIADIMFYLIISI